jgi:hypothetical protein
MLDYYQTQMADSEQDLKKVAEQQRVEQDPPTKNRLDRQIEQIGQAMDQWQQKIDQHQAKQQRQVNQSALETLLGILRTYTSQLELMTEAYRRTVSHWSVPVRLEATTVEALISELERIAPGQSPYTAREEWLARIVHNTTEPALSNALNQWGTQYHAKRNWLQLHTEIQTAQDKRLEKAHPAILMTITRCDQVSTQVQVDETYYQLDAWLIEDIETYRSHKTGYHNLPADDPSDAAPCRLEELLQKITRLLNHFLTEQKRVCEYCESYPQMHIFLPLELMHLGVDRWWLDPETMRRRSVLGHDHVVVIHCANRYEGSYRKQPSWLQLWRRHQDLLQESAQNVFVSGHDHDLDTLMELLDDAVQPDSKVVGLQVNQAPVQTEELCYELLDSGLPLALWSRHNLTELSPETELSNLLSTCCLERLPDTVKSKRSETRKPQNAPACHIGHHLSLLWDDPYLVPPKSA